MNESQIVPALSSAKTSSLAFLSAHPIGVAVVGGALIGIGAYYATKAIVGRRNKQDAPEQAASPSAA